MALEGGLDAVTLFLYAACLYFSRQALQWVINEMGIGLLCHFLVQQSA